MPIESASDRAGYMEAFGVAAVISGVTITAIYDDPHLETLGVNTSTPMLTCASSDVSSFGFGNSVVVSSVSFSGTIRDVQNDGTGITVLMLARS